MPSPENLAEFTEGFVIEDVEDPKDPGVIRARRKVVYNGVARLYKGVDWLELELKIDEDDDVGGTVYFVSFHAEEERELKPYNQLSPEERVARDEVQRHLTRNISK